LLAAIVPVILLLSGCLASPTSQPGVDSLESFYEQELALEACETPARTAGVDVPGECGSVEVPLDYEHPGRGTAQIAVFRIPATGADAIGSLFINPGGPGLPGVGYSADVAHAWVDSPVTSRFDLVGFDPRGTGTSKPAIDCHTDGERDADVLAATLLSLPDTRPLVDACADSVGGVDVLAHLGTRDAARDLDILRAVFGDDGLSYVGQSYGTRLGAVYAEMFPQKVRALVLDGAMDPHTTTSERRLVQWEGLQRGFDDLAEFCQAQVECPLGANAELATQAYQELVRPLLETPVPAGEGRELTYTAANDGVVTGLYSSAAWPAVLAGLAQLATGRGDILLGIRDFYHERSADGSYADSAEAAVAIDCLDEDRLSPKRQAELVTDTLAAAPFLDPGTPVTAVPDMCADWPVEPTLGFPYATDITGLPSTLTVSVTGDPVTPHEGGISLAKTLGGSLLTVEGAQHGSLIAGNECVDAAVVAYLVDLQTPPAGASCRL
jgi:pimeloyl-ACP methyl ester carboxylesterase